MAEKQHSLAYDNNILTIRGVTHVVSITDKEAEFKLDKNVLVVRGSGLNVTKLDKEQGVVVLETGALHSIAYRNGGFSFKGLLR